MSALEYMHTHRLDALVRDILTALLYHQPADPLDFCIGALRRIQLDRPDHAPFAQSIARYVEARAVSPRSVRFAVNGVAANGVAAGKNGTQAAGIARSASPRPTTILTPAMWRCRPRPRRHLPSSSSDTSAPPVYRIKSDEYAANGGVAQSPLALDAHSVSSYHSSSDDSAAPVILRAAPRPTRIHTRTLSSSDSAASPLPANGHHRQHARTLSVDPVLRTASPAEQYALHVAQSRGRRGSVSAESINPQDDYQKTIIPKSLPAMARIAAAIAKNLLFRNLEADQRREVVDAMFERRVPAGTVVIRQGDEGDNFYVVDDGAFEVLINGVRVTEVAAGGSFGELALMYNTPRAATVRALADATLWAVDRDTFRRTVTGNTFRKRRQYEQWLATVPVLTHLSAPEIVKLADALEPIEFDDGEDIIVQGAPGDYFYLLESGEARVSQWDEAEDAEYEFSPHLVPGAYFGELALINHTCRAATVSAVGPVKVLALSKDAFGRVLGGVVDVLRREQDRYLAAQRRRVE